MTFNDKLEKCESSQIFKITRIKMGDSFYILTLSNVVLAVA